jgi:hypothetical protein
MVWGYDKMEEFIKISVAKRLEKIPPEQIKTPLPQVAGPAIEALKYTGHDENLREMFAKLIATAMDSEKAALAHPSFVEIIKQLSSDEAKICRHLKGAADTLPVIEIDELRGNGISTCARNFSILGYKSQCEIPTLIQSYLDNLCRLGIVEISYEGQLADNSKYTEIERHPDCVNILQQLKSAQRTPHIRRGLIKQTTFGEKFFDACID